MEKKEAIREYCIAEAVKLLQPALAKEPVADIDDVLEVAKKLEDYITK